MNWVSCQISGNIILPPAIMVPIDSPIEFNSEPDPVNALDKPDTAVSNAPPDDLPILAATSAILPFVPSTNWISLAKSEIPFTFSANWDCPVDVLIDSDTWASEFT